MPFIDIEISLARDYVKTLKMEYSRWNHDTSRLSLEETAAYYQQLQIRLVRPQPREIHKSRSFQCPTSFKTALEVLENKFRLGLDVTPHLSRQIKNLQYSDKFLHDWGIHHFHLGTTIESDDFVSRTDEVLLAIIEPHHALFISIEKHNSTNNPNLWVQKKALETIRMNWPSWLERTMFNTGSTRVYSEQEQKTLRKKNANSAVTLDDGKEYYSPGLGVMANGMAMKARHYNNIIFITFERIEESIRNTPEKWLPIFYERLSKWPRKLSVSLIKLGDFIYIHGTNSPKGHLLFPDDYVSTESDQLQSLRRIWGESNCVNLYELDATFKRFKELPESLPTDSHTPAT